VPRYHARAAAVEGYDCGCHDHRGSELDEEKNFSPERRTPSLLMLATAEQSDEPELKQPCISSCAQANDVP
jgi:hypothetical protein